MAMRFTLEREGSVTLVGDEHGHGPAVVLLHAGAERRQVWDPVVEALVAAGYACTTLDQRGHGESGGSRNADFATFIADVEQLRRRVARPAVYVGSSLGGLSALAMVAAAQTHDAPSIAGLVLVDVVPDPNPERVDAGLTAALGQSAARSRLVLDILSQADALRDAARQLAVPTLLVRAEHSFGLHDDDAARFATLAPHAEQRTVENSGHLVARDQPVALARLLASFLARPDVAARASHSAPDTFARAESWLQRRSAAAVPHLAGTLLEHLRRTALWLDRWNAPEHLRLAGLCHAAYGTDGFATSLTDERATLIEAIGARAEQVVHTYGACDREHLYAQLGQADLVLRVRYTGETRALSLDEVSDFTLLTLANELDAALGAPPASPLRTAIESLFRRLALHRPVEAAAALRALDRRQPKGDA
jgi:pimeloyl-ACP methyl ester carboxylesterase